MRPHERFDAWKNCHRLTLAIYASTARWPKQEMFGLTAQTRRAAVSAVANIVEGAAKRGPREFRRYLDISNGSLAELGCLLDLACELGYLSRTEWPALETAWERAAQATMGLYRSLRPERLRRLEGSARRA